MTQFPLKLTSEIFSIKPSWGADFFGKISDQWTNSTNYFTYRAEEEPDYSATINLFLEFGLSVFENFSLSAGAGYFSKGLNGTRGIFDLPATAELQGNFASFPQFNFKSYFTTLTAQWAFPISSEAQVYILGGIGYYFSRFTISNKQIYYYLRPSGSTLNYFPADFRGRTNSFGYHAGAGVETEIDWNVFLFVESLYRRVNFKKFKKDFGASEESPAYTLIKNILGDSAAESTFLYYYNWGGEEEWGDIIYSINNILLSEIILRMGIRVKF